MTDTIASTAASSVSPQMRAKIQQAAQKFEAVTIGQMLTPMFATIDQSNSAFGGGEGESAWRPMWINAVAEQMAAHGGIGLARPIAQQMLQIQEQANDQH